MNVIAKKSLGQNFLIDKKVIDVVVDTINIKDKIVLEVGPGTGNLTKALLEKKPKKLFAIEKDRNLASLLKTEFKNKISVINDDILKINENIFCNEKLIVFGNLPYNISTEILCKWIINIHDNNLWFDYLILMFQKEVADRIVSKFNTKNYGRLSVLSNWKLNIKKIFDVKPSCFSPRPKVESTVLLFQPKRNFVKLNNPKNLEKITKIFFMHRRKMIKKAYNQVFNGNLEIAAELGIDLNLRPQNLNYNTYYKLVEKFENLRS